MTRPGLSETLPDGLRHPVFTGHILGHSKRNPGVILHYQYRYARFSLQPPPALFKWRARLLLSCDRFARTGSAIAGEIAWRPNLLLAESAELVHILDGAGIVTIRPRR